MYFIAIEILTLISCFYLSIFYTLLYLLLYPLPFPRIRTWDVENKIGYVGRTSVGNKIGDVGRTSVKFFSFNLQG